jgi:hypothetical protein
MNTYRTLLGLILCPFVIAAGWSISASGRPAPGIGWVMNAAFAYPAFFILLAFSLLLAHLTNLRHAWQRGLLLFALSVVASCAYNFLMFSHTYSAYQVGHTTVVENSRITADGERILIEFAVRDGLLFVTAFAVFTVISGTRARH